MEVFLTFEELAESIEPFNPPYTEDFRKYMEDSLRRSQIASFEAERSAAKVLII